MAFCSDIRSIDPCHTCRVVALGKVPGILRGCRQKAEYMENDAKLLSPSSPNNRREHTNVLIHLRVYVSSASPRMTQGYVSKEEGHCCGLQEEQKHARRTRPVLQAFADICWVSWGLVAFVGVDWLLNV